MKKLSPHISDAVTNIFSMDEVSTAGITVIPSMQG